MIRLVEGEDIFWLLNRINMMKERYISVDVFRGFTIALMIIVNSPGNWGNTFRSQNFGLKTFQIVFFFFAKLTRESVTGSLDVASFAGFPVFLLGK